MAESRYAIGIDFGSDSVRTLLVDIVTGEEVASEVAWYPRWGREEYCDPGANQFRQHPLDYLESLENSVRGALNQVSPQIRENVTGIGIDTTGSTPCPVDKNGTPLALLEEFRENPNAMFVLWKDHTAIEEAAEINRAAHSGNGPDYTKYSGGTYSSEWFWAKILHILRKDSRVRDNAFSWVEHCDWIPAILTGTEKPEVMKRSRCAAGHKAMWHEDWNGLPDNDFLAGIDPLLKGLRNNLYNTTYTADTKVGSLTEEWARRLNLKPGIAVSGGAFDAHMGAVGGGITEKTLVKIMGTSTCDMMVVPKEELGGKLVDGICGQVDGSVLPDMIGLEAGQSAFGDVYAWFRKLIAWPLEKLGEQVGLRDDIKNRIEEEILTTLSKEASALDPAANSVTALDWLNGRRTPYADQRLKGALAGLTLGTDAPAVLRALVEATAFGSRAIIDRLREEGVEINEVIAEGGIPAKNDFVMQVTADVINMPIKVARSSQCCALGAAMFGAAAAGEFESIFAARKSMESGFIRTFEPDPDMAEKYNKNYNHYLQLGSILENTLREL